MINHNERLIIVVGMAHSSTTIMTYLLKQHPDVYCHSIGTESWLFESDFLSNVKSDSIQNLLDNNLDKRVLLKKPWNTSHHGEWMQREMPDARYLYCLRPFEDITISWSKSDSFMPDELRYCGRDCQKMFYEICLSKDLAFGESVSNFRISHYSDFVSNPIHTMNSIGDWLGLSEFKWDVSDVGVKKNIKASLQKKWTSHL